MEKGKVLLNLLFILALFGVGFSLLTIYASWQVSLGVFLVLWANNRERMIQKSSILELRETNKQM